MPTNDAARRAALPCLWALLALALALPVGLTGVPPGGLRVASADEGDDGKPAPDDGNPAPDDGKDEGADLGDKDVPFADQVNKAIELGVNWLLAKPDYFSERKFEFAHWGLIDAPTLYGGGTGPKYQHPAGPTALAIYTLLKCDVSPKHPVVEKGFNWLRENHTITPKWDSQDGQGFTWRHTEAGSSYELSAMILALTAKYDAYKKTSASKVALRKGKLKIRDKDDLEWLIEMVDALIQRRGQPAESPSREEMLGWRYNAPILTRGSKTRTWTRGATRTPPHANQDMSSTQLAALALFSAQRFGMKVPAQVWLDIVEFTLGHQETEGPEHKRHMPGYVPDRYGPNELIDHARGFMYIKGSPDRSEGKATGSMTACGVANLLIARESIAQDKKMRDEFVASGMLKKVDTAIQDGLAWLDLNWSSFQNPRSQYGYHIYYLYCVERTMDLLDKRLLGRRLWYPEGAKEILARQKPVRVTVPEKRGEREADGVFWNTDATHDPKDVLDTCFALLYLKRATKGLIPGAVVTGGAGGAADSR